MRYLDVCSGYSAASLAWQGFGWEAVGYSEIDPFASALLAYHWGATAPMRMPDPEEAGLVAKDRKARLTAIKTLPHYFWDSRIPNFGDFTTIERDDVGPVDLLIGGTPCQGFSQAGKRLGLADPRGNLTLEFLALAGRLQPKWLAWENVFGFLSHDDGRTAGTFFRLLGELGYGWAYRVLDAQFIRVDGLEGAVPQRRRRVFVVGCLGNPSAAASVLFDPYSLRGDPCPRREPGQTVAGTVRASAGKRGGVQDEADSSGLIAAPIAPTIDRSYARLQGASGQDLGHGHSHLIGMRMVSFGEYVPDDVAGTMKARDRAGRETDLIVQPDVAAPLRAGGPESGWTNDLDGGTFVPVPPEVANTLTGEGYDAGDDGTKRTLMPAYPASIIPLDTTPLTNPNNRSNPQIGDPCHPLAESGHPPTIAFNALQDPDVSGDIAGPLTGTADRTGQAQAICIHADAVGRGGKALTPSADAEGRVRLRDPGIGVSEEASFAMTTGAPHAVAFQERGRPGGRAIEHQEGVAYALTAPDKGGRRNEMNIVAPPAEDPFVFQTRIARNDRGQPDFVVPALNGVNAGDTSDMRPVLAQPSADGWQVRRLTPVECERLQGCPDRFTHIRLKKRQRTKVDHDLAVYWLSQEPTLTLEDMQHLCADSPRYRVLGNSYATNCIRWIGWGIYEVERILAGRG